MTNSKAKRADVNRYSHLKNTPPICKCCDYPLLQNLEGMWEHWGELYTPEEARNKSKPAKEAGE